MHYHVMPRQAVGGRADHPRIFYTLEEAERAARHWLRRARRPIRRYAGRGSGEVAVYHHGSPRLGVDVVVISCDPARPEASRGCFLGAGLPAVGPAAARMPDPWAV